MLKRTFNNIQTLEPDFKAVICLICDRAVIDCYFAFAFRKHFSSKALVAPTASHGATVAPPCGTGHRV